MSIAVLSAETFRNAWPLSEVEPIHDIQVNAMDVDELFALYERTGFLYPAKAARLLPHLDVVRDNWCRLLGAGDSLLYVLTAGDEENGRASITGWRTTGDSWVWQHMVCESQPLRSRDVMLGGILRCIREGIGRSQQNWFRPENRFPSRVFGSMVQTLGESFSSVRRHMYFAVPRRPSRRGTSSTHVVPYDSSQREALCALAGLARGGLYVTAEALDRDVELQSVDALYRRAGLRRTRHVWLAYRPGTDAPVGAAIAYRGPLGLNFSFLENRCDLVLHPALSDGDASAVSTDLIEAAMAAYDGFELDEIPVVADNPGAPALCALGGQFLRSYCQGIWLEDGQPQLYRHVDRFYTRLLNRVERRAVSTALSA